MSNRVEYCGIALIGFDAEIYEIENPQESAFNVVDKAKKEVRDLLNIIESSTFAQKLDSFEIQFLCVPFPSVEEFRKAFLASLGLIT